MVGQNSAFFLSLSPKLTVPLPLLWSKFGGGILRCEEGGREGGRQWQLQQRNWTRRRGGGEERRRCCTCVFVNSQQERACVARQKPDRGSISSYTRNEMATGWPASRILPSRLKTRSWRSAVAFHAGCRCTAGNATAVAFSPSCVRSPVRSIILNAVAERPTATDRATQHNGFARSLSASSDRTGRSF